MNKLIQNQRFLFKKPGEEKDSHYLLMPNEVTEFFELIGKGLSVDYAFTRLTGKDPAELSDIRLEVVNHFRSEE